MINRIALFLFLLFTLSCSSYEDVRSMEEDAEQLQNQFDEIQLLASSANCVDSVDWSYVAYGARACGGPQGFISYYVKIDTGFLFAQLNSYEANEKAFNQKWNINSICTVPTPPNGVKCEDGKAILLYE